MLGISLDRAVSWVVAILISSGVVIGVLILGASAGQRIMDQRMQSVDEESSKAYSASPDHSE